MIPGSNGQEFHAGMKMPDEEASYHREGQFMDLEFAMKQQVFAVVGDTVNETKYAYRIKQALLEQGKTVYCVGKELTSLNEVPETIDVIILCINHHKGLPLLQECTKTYRGLIVQPGAESPEILEYLDTHQSNYMQGCILIGISTYGKGIKHEN